MRRQSSPDKKVEVWTHSGSGLETVIYLRGTDFVAMLLGREFEAPNVAIIRSKMADFCEHWITMEWHPLIEIKIGEGRSGYRDEPEGASIEFATRRFWVSKSPAGEYFNCHWDVDEEHRKAKMERYGITTSYGRRFNEDRHNILKIIGLPLGAPLEIDRGSRYLLDHTDELWDRFEGLIAGIEAMKKTVRDLVSTRAGIDRLLTGGGSQLLLQGGKRK